MSMTTFIGFIKDKLTKAVLISVTILLLISVAANIYFILGGGLKIDKSINTVNIQGQSQSTLVINGTPYSSEQIQWIKVVTNTDALCSLLESLTSFQIWNSKIIKRSILSDDIILFYPDIKEKKK